LNFAREGLLFIAIAAVIAAGGFAFAINRRSWGLWLAAFVLLLLALWVAYFFRDPERTGERGPSLVVSPADGKLIMITEVDEPTFVQGRAIRLSIFMNVFNVHVNRYPVDGVVRHVHYNKGKFLNAAAEKSSLENEQMSVGIERAWDGLFATTPDGLPYIGRHSRFPRRLFALGYGGNGMTFGFLAARMLLEQWREIDSPDHALFGFGRFR